MEKEKEKCPKVHDTIPLGEKIILRLFDKIWNINFIMMSFIMELNAMQDHRDFGNTRSTEVFKS